MFSLPSSLTTNPNPHSSQQHNQISEPGSAVLKEQGAVAHSKLWVRGTNSGIEEEYSFLNFQLHTGISNINKWLTNNVRSHGHTVILQ